MFWAMPSGRMGRRQGWWGHLHFVNLTGSRSIVNAPARCAPPVCRAVRIILGRRRRRQVGWRCVHCPAISASRPRQFDANLLRVGTCRNDIVQARRRAPQLRRAPATVREDTLSVLTEERRGGTHARAPPCGRRPILDTESPAPCLLADERLVRRRWQPPAWKCAVVDTTSGGARDRALAVDQHRTVAPLVEPAHMPRHAAREQEPAVCERVGFVRLDVDELRRRATGSAAAAGHVGSVAPHMSPDGVAGDQVSIVVHSSAHEPILQARIPIAPVSCP